MTNNKNRTAFIKYKLNFKLTEALYASARPAMFLLLFMAAFFCLISPPAAMAQSSQTLDLKPGFNFISFTVVPSLTPQALMTQSGQIEDIYSYSAASGSFLSYGEGSLTVLAPAKGYIFKAKTALTLEVSGAPLGVTNNITLKPGFNLVGFSKAPESLNFSSLIDRSAFIKGIYKWSPASGMFVQVLRNSNGTVELIDSTDPKITAAQAYFINLSQETTLNYDGALISVGNSSGGTTGDVPTAALSDIVSGEQAAGMGDLEGEISAPTASAAPFSGFPQNRAINIISLSSVKIWVKTHPEINALTDQAGKFSLNNIPAAAKGSGHTLEYEKSEGADMFKGVVMDVPVIERKKIDLKQYIGDLAIKKTGTIQGRIALSDGLSPLGADVFIPALTSAFAKVDEDGSYALLYIPEGVHTVVFQLAGYGVEKREAVVVSGETRQLDRVTLSAVSAAETNSSMSGYILDPEGSAVANAYVTIVSKDAATDLISVSSNNGRFQFGGLNANEYKLIVSKEGFKGTEESISLSAAENKNINVNLEKSASSITQSLIAGYVKNSRGDAPVSNAGVVSIPPVKQLFTDASGYFSLLAPAGDYTIIVSKAGFEDESLSLKAVEGRFNEVKFFMDAAAENITASSLFLNRGRLIISRGETFQFVPTLKDSGGNIINSRNVTWTSSDPSVCDIGQTGLLTARSEGGAVISASSDTVASSCEVLVGAGTRIVKSLKIIPSSCEVNVGEIKNFSAVAVYDDGRVEVLPPAALNWTHSEKLSLVAPGSFTGTSAGTAQVSALYAGFEIIAPVAVKTVVTDNIAPQISHRTPLVGSGENAVITADIFDNSGISKVSIYHKKLTDPSFTVNEMTKISQTAYSFVFLAGSIDAAGVSYYIRAEDNNSSSPNVSTFPANGEKYPALLKLLTLKSLSLSRSADRVCAGDHYDLNSINSLASYSDGRVKDVSPQWKIISGGGEINQNVYTAPQNTTQAILSAVFSESSTEVDAKLTIDYAKNPFIGNVAAGYGFTGRVYKISQPVEKFGSILIPNYPVSEFKTPALNVPTSYFDSGFTGGGKGLIDNFVIKFSAKVKVPAAREYNFKLASDDGARLFVDNQPVVNNDGVHLITPASGKIYLSAGEHYIMVDYFQARRYYVALQLFWDEKGYEEIIPSDRLLEWNGMKTPVELLLSKTIDGITAGGLYNLSSVSARVRYSDNTFASVTPVWSLKSGSGYTAAGLYMASGPANAVLNASYSENNSSVNASLLLNNPVTQSVSAPVFSLTPGRYVGAQSVELSTATPGASIYYTLNGSEPSVKSTLYISPIALTESVTIKAAAFKESMINSPVSTASYAISESSPSDSDISYIYANFDRKTTAQKDIIVTLKLNGNSFTALKNGAVSLRPGIDYIYVNETLLIKKEYLAAQNTGFTTLVFLFSAGANRVLTINVMNTSPNSAVLPFVRDYVKNVSLQGDMIYTMILNSNTLISVRNSANVLRPLIDYTIGADRITIKKQYLDGLPSGSAALTFEFSAGAAAVCVINVSDAAPLVVSASIYPSVAYFEKAPELQKDISVNLILNSNSLSGIKLSHTAVTLDPAVDYTIISSDSITLKKQFLLSLSSGENSLDFEFSGGDTQPMKIFAIENTVSSIKPSYAFFDKKTALQANITVSLPFASNMLKSIKKGVNPLSLNTHYLLTASGVILKKEFLVSNPLGPSNLLFEFYNSSSEIFVVNTIDTNDSLVSPSFAAFDKNPLRSADVPVTMILNGNSLLSVKRNGWPLVPNIEYSVSGSQVVIKKQYLSLFEIEYANYSFIFDNGAPQAVTVKTIDTSVKTINPVYFQFDKKVSAQSDLSVKLPSDSTLSVILKGSSILKKTVDYTDTVDGVIIKKEFMNTLSAGLNELLFVLGNSSQQGLMLNVINSQNSSINITEAAIDKSSAALSDISVILNFNSNSLVAVKNSGVMLVNAVNYMISGNLLTIKKEYLKTLTVGTNTLSFEFNAGLPCYLTLEISDSLIVKTPAISPAAGDYTDTVQVAISCATPGAVIYYTTNGTAPTTSSAVYLSTIEVSATKTIKAIAVKSGMNNSLPASSLFNIVLPGDYGFNITAAVYDVNADAVSYPYGFVPKAGAVEEGEFIELTVTAKYSNGKTKTDYSGSGVLNANEPLSGVLSWEGTGVGDDSETSSNNSGSYSPISFSGGVAKIYVRYSRSNNFRINIYDSSDPKVNGSLELSWVPENTLPGLIFEGENSRGFRRYYSMRDGSVRFVKIPAGSFERGDGTNGGVPMKIKMSSYFMAESPVTNDQISSWRSSLNAPALEGGWNSDNGAGSYGVHPAMFLTFNDAKRYAHWLVNGDNGAPSQTYLMSEAQYEKAARGMILPGLQNAALNKFYPWGNLMNASLCNEGASVTADERVFIGNGAGTPGTTPVYKYQPQGYYGLYDITGNYRQWCADYHYASQPPGVMNPLNNSPNSPSAHSVRGGGYGEADNNMFKCSYKSGLSDSAYALVRPVYAKGTPAGVKLLDTVEVENNYRTLEVGESLNLYEVNLRAVYSDGSVFNFTTNEWRLLNPSGSSAMFGNTFHQFNDLNTQSVLVASFFDGYNTFDTKLTIIAVPTTYTFTFPYDTLEMVSLRTFEVDVTVRRSSGDEIWNPSLTWTSQNPSFFTVDQSGLITAKYNPAVSVDQPWIGTLEVAYGGSKGYLPVRILGLSAVLKLNMNSCTLNSKALNAQWPEIIVNPGGAITGNFSVKSHNTMIPGAVFPIGYTWTWGNRQTDIVTVNSWAGVGDISHTGSMNLTAPMTPGSYYIFFGAGGEMNCGNIMSLTSWTTAEKWNDGNDVADWGEELFKEVNSYGYATVPYDVDGSHRWTAARVASCAIKVVVRNSPVYTFDSLTLSQPSGSIKINQAFPLSTIAATANYSDSLSETVEVTWSKISGLGTLSGLIYTASSTDETAVFRASHTVSGTTKTADFSLSVKALSSIELNPPSAFIPVSGTYNLSNVAVTANYSDSTTASVAPYATWTKTSGLGTLTGKIYTATASVETATFTATYNDSGITKTASFSLDVSGGLMGITVVPGNGRLTIESPGPALYDCSAVTVIANYANGTTADVTLNVKTTWSKISGLGTFNTVTKVYTSIATPETAVLRAQYKPAGTAYTADFTLKAVTLDSITLSSLAEFCGTGGSFDLSTITAAANYSDLSTAAVSISPWVLTSGSGTLNGSVYTAPSAPTQAVFTANYLEAGNNVTAQFKLHVLDATDPSVVLTDSYTNSNGENYIPYSTVNDITATFTEDNLIDEASPPKITIKTGPDSPIVTPVNNLAMTKISNKVWKYTWTVPANLPYRFYYVVITARDQFGNFNKPASGQTKYVIYNPVTITAPWNSPPEY